MCGFEDHRARLIINGAVAGAILLYVGSDVAAHLKTNTVHEVPLVPGGAPGQFYKPQCIKIHAKDPIDGRELQRILAIEQRVEKDGFKACVIRVRRD